MAGPAPADWSVDPETAGAREVAPGLWRLRLPLAWAGNGHANAYAIPGDDGVVLIDCGSAGDPSSARALDVALGAAGHRVQDVSLLVGTHAHSDHVGLAADVIERSGCAFWMHPDTAAMYDGFHEPLRVQRQRARFARREGVPEELIPDFADTSEETQGILAPVEPDRDLREGVRVPTALGAWRVVETPGHAPSHVCLVQDDHRYAVVADVVCSAFAPWFDVGYSPDPYVEWQASLERVAGLGDLALALPGHGRPMPDLPGSLHEHVTGLRGQLGAVRDAVADEPGSAWSVAQRALGVGTDPFDAVWRMDRAFAYLRHLHVTGEVVREIRGDRAVHRPA